jgi:hypothetical protein
MGGYQEDRQQQQQYNSAVYGGSDLQQQHSELMMQLHAGGQRMVLDLDELVGGVEGMEGLHEGGGPWSAVAAA